MTYLLVLAVGLGAGTISGIIGTGASIMLVPVLVLAFGPKQAVPIMAIAALMGNVAKMLAWWREIDWRACLAYSVTGIPAAALGARTLLALPTRTIDVALGVFFLAMIPFRRWLDARRLRLSLWHLALAGAAVGFLTGVVASTGPLSVPAFTAYGLIKGGFIATEAASSLAVYVSKVVTFRELGALSLDAIVKGVITGSSLMLGAFVARRLVLRLSPRFYRLLLDGLLLCSGLTLLWAATR
jgi:uncharacterized membrane protein YfcA